MRVRPAVAAVPLLLLLLTWLSFRAIDPNAERFDHALGALDHFETGSIQNVGEKDAGDMTGRSVAGWGFADGVGLTGLVQTKVTPSWVDEVGNGW
jgi:hypothetical protein